MSDQWNTVHDRHHEVKTYLFLTERDANSGRLIDMFMTKN